MRVWNGTMSSSNRATAIGVSKSQINLKWTAVSGATKIKKESVKPSASFVSIRFRW
jgi:hypothetical protein